MADFVDDSVTQEIVAAKNQLVAQGNRAQTIVDEWEGLTDLLQDAPQDGVTYGRKDGGWVEAGGAGGSGDMTKAVYDPNNIESDAFARSNHTGTQLISTVSGLQTELDSKLEDAATDGSTYGRKEGAWSVINTLTAGEVFDAAAEMDGTDSIFSNKGNLKDATTGFISVDATGSNQGVFPKDDRFSCYLVTAPNIVVVNHGVPYFYDTSDFIAVAHTGGIYYAQGVENSTDDVEFVEIANASTGGATNLSTAATANDVTVASDTGDDATIQGASGTNAGVMTSADYTKLDGVEDGAEVNTVDSVFGRTGAISSSTGDYNGSQVTESTTPTNYTPAGGTVSGHLAGIDSALASAGGGTTTFTGLTDTPSAYTGEAGKVLAVNTGETGVEFIDAPAGGGGDPIFTNQQVRITLDASTAATDGDFKPQLITQLAPLANRNIYLKIVSSPDTTTPFTFPTPDELGWSAGDKCKMSMTLRQFESKVSQLTLNNTTNGGIRISLTQEEVLNSGFLSEAEHDYSQQIRFNMTAFTNYNDQLIFDPTHGN